MNTWGLPSSCMPEHPYEIKQIQGLQMPERCEGQQDCEELARHLVSYGKIGEYWAVSKKLCEGHIEWIEPIEVIKEII